MNGQHPQRGVSRRTVQRRRAVSSIRIGKLLNNGSFAAELASTGLPCADILAPLAMTTEILGATALILGVAPRLTALFLAAFTLGASLITHRFWMYADAVEAALSSRSSF